MDSLVILITSVSTSTSRCGNNFLAMGWQVYTDILNGVDIPAGKYLFEKGDFRKIVQDVFFFFFVLFCFVAIWRETPIYIFVLVNVIFPGEGSYNNCPMVEDKKKKMPRYFWIKMTNDFWMFMSRYFWI